MRRYKLDNLMLATHDAELKWSLLPNSDGRGDGRRPYCDHTLRIGYLKEDRVKDARALTAA